MELLPHAAADTEHTSRVEGAKQAVDQILSAIRFRKVINCKGDIPEGYVDGGPQTVPGVGQVSEANIAAASANADTIKRLRDTTEALAAILGGIESTRDPIKRQELIQKYGEELVLNSNMLNTDLNVLGLLGSYNGK